MSCHCHQTPKFSPSAVPYYNIGLDVLNAGLTPSTMTGGAAFVWGNREAIFR